jgi:alpha-L-fucosidase
LAVAAPGVRSAEVDLAQRAEELKDLKFGMMIAWSLSTFSGQDETIGCKDLSLFHPTGCDIDQWVRVGQEAGMGYFVFCAKHCDGFCLWDTKTTDRQVTKSPWGQDVLAAARRACDKYGVKMALYYEEGDWTWPGAIEGGADWPGAKKGAKYPSGLIAGVPQAGGSNPEVKKAQLRELLTQYGPIEFLWFDHALGDGGLDHNATVAFVRSLQPGCLVGFNSGQPAGELRLGEGGKPSALGDPSGAGVNRKQQATAEYKGYLVAEFVKPIQTGNSQPARWFYSGPENEDKVMPVDDILALYWGAVKFRNIFTLSVAPDRAGRLREIDVRTLREVGRRIRALPTATGEAAELPTTAPSPTTTSPAGKVIQAASVAQADVQAAVDAARDGDTVLIPEGTTTWKVPAGYKPAVLIDGKAITLQGAGLDKTVINVDLEGQLVLHAKAAEGKPFRITGLTLKFLAIQPPRSPPLISVTGRGRNWRIDHCGFEGLTVPSSSPAFAEGVAVGRGVYAWAHCYGLIDHCTFVNLRQSVSVNGAVDASWEEPLALGTAEAVYVEDCDFRLTAHPDGVNDAYDGARYVFRHNTVTGFGSLGHHGFDSALRSTFSFEIYENTIRPHERFVFTMHLRGGTGVIFGNRITGGKAAAIIAANYRSDEQYRNWLGNKGLCDGQNPLDGNEEPNGYPSRDQIGRATDQILDPLYAWDNTRDGQGVNVSVKPTAKEHIHENRDYCHTARPGYRPYPYPHPLQAQWPPLPPADVQPPGVPERLAARAVGEREVELCWQPSLDNVAVAGYYVWRNGKKMVAVTDPQYLRYRWLRLKLPLEQYAFAVSAFDAAGNESSVCAAVQAGR